MSRWHVIVFGKVSKSIKRNRTVRNNSVLQIYYFKSSYILIIGFFDVAPTLWRGILTRHLAPHCNAHCFWSRVKTFYTRQIARERNICFNKTNITMYPGTRVTKVCSVGER